MGTWVGRVISTRSLDNPIPFWEPRREPHQRRALSSMRIGRVESAFSLNDPIQRPPSSSPAHEKSCESAPSHDVGSRYPLGSALRLIIFELISLVDDLFRDDLLDDVCECVHPSSYEPLIRVLTVTCLQGL